ncbi:MAG: zinc-ribbon domain-containing protein [Desulfobacterales bacterium]|nr:zinc-ribbon domain-containing protein [Desulfobacterales bacterium]
MIITCEACGTNYKIKSSLISQNGSTVKCSRCQHIFVAYPPSSKTGKSDKTRSDTEVTSADYPQPGTSTFFEDAAETEKKLDALFSEEPESQQSLFEDLPEPGGEAGGPESAAEEEEPFDFPEYQSDVDLSDLEYEPEDVFADEFESPAEEINLSDLEYDADFELSELEEEPAEMADLESELGDLEEKPAELKDLEPEPVNLADLEPESVNLSDLEPEPVNLADLETIQALQTGGQESRPSSETTQETLGEEFVFDLEREEEEADALSLGLDQSELEGQPGKESAGLGYEADADLSDLEYEPEDVFADEFESPAEEINLSDLEYDADIELADLEEEPVEMADLESEPGDLEEKPAELSDLEPGPVNLADLEAPEPEPVELKHLESEVVALQDLESESVEIKDLESEPLDLTDLEAEPAEAIDLESGQEVSDEEEADLFDFETGAEEAETEKETTQEEFDLDDLDWENWDDEEEKEFDLDLEEIDFDLETEKTAAGEFGTEETLLFDTDFETQEAGEETRPEPEIEPDKEARPAEPEAGAETESGEESFELDLDFEEPEEGKSEEGESEEEAAYGQGETFELGLEEDRSLEEEDREESFEFDLGLEEEAEAEDVKEAGGEDRMEPEPDLDFEKGPEEQPEEKAEAESEEIELEFDFETPETGQEKAEPAGEKQEESGEEELDLTDLEDFLEETGETDREDTGRQEEAEFDLDLETAAETRSTGGDEDFDIDLSTMLDETFEEEPESEKDVSLEPVESEKEEPEPEPAMEQYREPGAARADETHFAAVSPPGAKEADTAPPEAPAPSPAAGKKGRGKKLLAVIAAIIVLGVIGGGAYFYYIQQIAPSTVQDAGNVNMNVSTPDYGFVNNANAGRLLVVTGRVTNRYEHARGNILVRANVLDSGGNRIKRAAAYCGNMFTPNQLKTLDLQSINQRLSRSEGEGGANSRVGPNQSIPFTVVLSDLPENMASLKVEVVSSEKVR